MDHDSEGLNFCLELEAPFSFKENIPWGDKVSMLTHIYLHKHQRKIRQTICNHQADSPLNAWLDCLIW